MLPQKPPGQPYCSRAVVFVILAHVSLNRNIPCPNYNATKITGWFNFFYVLGQKAVYICARIDRQAKREYEIDKQKNPDQFTVQAIITRERESVKGSCVAPLCEPLIYLYFTKEEGKLE